MTTKPRASLYRLKPGGPLAAGVDAALIAELAAEPVGTPPEAPVRKAPARPGTDAAEAPPARGRPAGARPGPAEVQEPEAAEPDAAGPEAPPRRPAPDARADLRRDRLAEAMRGTAAVAGDATPVAAWGEAEAEPRPAAPRREDGRTGEIASASEVDTETAIAAIRREGLTGRQLRMARRVAQKHGLAPISDFDAVRQLRARGIDPFDRANVLQLVADNESPVADPADSGAAAEGRSQLPATRPLAPPPALPQPEIRIPQERAGEIWKIQQDLARRRRRKMVLLGARLAVFVLLPTLVVGWYFAVMATPMYATRSEFVIQQADAPARGGLGGLFAGTGLAVQTDSTTVQSYLQSRDALRRLDADLGFKAHFSQDWIDPIQRLDPGASNEEAYRVFQRNVKVGFDPSEGILKMEVIAASPAASEAFAKGLIGYAEEQVDNLTQRLRADQMSGAEESFADAERRVQEAQARVLELQERLGVLDPVSETGSLMSQITQFEVQLREKQLELEQLLSNPRPSEARVEGVRGDIARLESLVVDLRRSMTEGQNGGASLARISGELRIAEADLTTRQLLLQQAAQQLETARIEANRQVRYMAIGVSPVAPDEATYPRAFENTALAFLIFSGIYLMVSLTAAVLREQVSA